MNRLPVRPARLPLLLLIVGLVVSCSSSPGSKDDHTVPGAPTPTANPRNGFVSLSWPVVNDAVEYRIYWSTTPGGTRDMSAPIPVTELSYQHEGLSNGQTYYYAVTALSEFRESEKSEELSATPIPPPDAPQNLRAVLELDVATLEWDVVPGATGYNVYSDNASGVASTKINSASANIAIQNTQTTTVAHANPIPGTPMYFVVTAINDSGESSDSKEVTAKPLLLSLAAGANHTCAVQSDGTLWCWGKNGTGQLGVGDTKNRYVLTQVGADRDWMNVTGGAEHTCAIREKNNLRTLWCWGDNAYGQLGDGSDQRKTSPVQIGSSENWATVESGSKHTCAIKADHSLWCWGDNTYNQLGAVPSVDKPDHPLRVGNETNWNQIALGDNHTCGLKIGGELWCWGDNGFGKLGTVGDGKVPQQIESNIKWVYVALGGDHSCGVKSDTTLWCWGKNRTGQVGNHSTDNQPVPANIGAGWSTVALGATHTCALRLDGTPWCWGANDYGQLHTGDKIYRSDPTKLGSGFSWHTVTLGDNHTCALSQDKVLGCWGHNAYGQRAEQSTQDLMAPILLPDVGHDWESVSSGFYHTCGIKLDKSLWCWGWNRQPYPLHSYGIENKWLSVAVMGASTCAVHISGLLLCGAASTLNGELYGRQYGGSTGWSKVEAYGNQICAVKTDRTLWCGQEGSTLQKNDDDVDENAFSTWCYLKTGGSMVCNGIGSGAPTDWRSISVPIPTCGIKIDGTLICNGTIVNEDKDWSMVSASDWGSWCAVKTSGTLWCGGHQVEKATDWRSISLGFSSPYMCAVKTDGTLWCWGSNHYKQLGDGTDIDKPTPVPVVSSAIQWSQITAGSHHTCAINNGSLFCWGHNGYGQLGDGSTNTKTTPTPVVSSVSWKSIAAGTYHTCGVKYDSTLWCWGANADGQLGISGNETALEPTQVGTVADSNWIDVATSAYHTCARKVDNTLWCWGRNISGQLGTNDRDRRLTPQQIGSDPDWIFVATGDNHTCAIKEKNSIRTLWCWGANTKGQLGNRTTTDGLLPVQVVAPGTSPSNSFPWHSVTAGSHHTCALAYSGYPGYGLLCWGDHGHGQLGYGIGPDQTIPVAVDSLPWTSVVAAGDRTCGGMVDRYSPYSYSPEPSFSLWCWGDNSSGRLGNGTNYGQSSPSPVQTEHGVTPYQWIGIAAGEKHTCALRAGGTLWCWGDNTDGQLGSGP